jgi:hypothetical protein
MPGRFAAMRLVILVVVAVVVGLAGFWVASAQLPEGEDRVRVWRRFAVVWTPLAALLVLVVELTH